MLISFHRPNFWLRDNCRCSECVNQDTMQRNFDTFSIPPDIRPVSAGIEGDNLHVTFPFDDVMNPDSEEGIARLTRLILSHGFAFVSNTPVSPDETKRLLEHIGPIRNTHYGGFYDFIPDMALADTAYTNLALPAHTDTTYFTEPAGLQAFHLLSHHPPPSSPSGAVAEGGKTLLVDGFSAAVILRGEDPDAYTTLMKYGVDWHASGNKGIAIKPKHKFPVLEGSRRQNLPFRVRWNNDDRGVAPLKHARLNEQRKSQKGQRGNQPSLKVESSGDWYAAARKWNEIIKRKEMEYWVQLTPGNVLIFNNWRVLHGRSAFEGVRRICGGYINHDDFVSRWRNTNFSREQVLRQVVG
ncbi:hypothetical protein PpBr36_02363 [Pyricularia pennisetigena]|uniref:hypothetical protein n=1 Tax=Pyricularia pennisetigena TaxID=1578925 RepID=UPI00114EF1A7|nr:hypothetical protein PpBr36_02363 [Pyricularia pennisetigena]TLS30289.1 hypothetical protein PpBr36_02363 [Pyricularia pennisetigena]